MKKVRTTRTDKKSRVAITRTGAWKPIFIENLSRIGNVTCAMNAAKVDRPTVYHHRKTDSKFAAKWRAALKQAADVMEEEARRRAIDGVEKPISIGGKREVIREFSDTLLIFLLKGNKPEKFRDNVRQEITGKNGGSLKILTANADLDRLSVDELRTYRDLLAKASATAHVGTN